jgi:predicted phage-related endonuclease
MPIERRPITDRDEWLQWRRQDVTASTIGALFGVHPYTSALKLYVEKRGVEFIVEDNPMMRRGRWLEPAVGTAVAELHPEWTITKAGVYLRDPERRIGASPDFFIEGDPRGPGVLQAKSAAPWVFERDWDDGREAPAWIVFQTRLEMMLAEAAFGVIAVLIDDARDCFIIELERNDAVEAEIIAAAATFWRNVEQGIEPPADYAKDSEAIRALTSRVTPGKTFDASGLNELPILLQQRAELMARIKSDDARCTEIENEIKLAMGDAEVIVGLEGWRVTHKTVSVKEYTVKARSSRQLRILDKRPVHERPQGDEAA